MKEIYYFTAPWCKSCANLKPHIGRVKAQGLTVHEINVDVNPGITEAYEVMQLPTLILIQDGAVIKRKAGFSESLVLELNDFTKVP